MIFENQSSPYAGLPVADESSKWQDDAQLLQKIMNDKVNQTCQNKRNIKDSFNRYLSLFKEFGHV